ncbi:hypothetical protein C7476_11196 [Phyllobacterium bourgognense]|uniref:Uncharacterized protein n=1 Tax=Phyllobacterium bourgognense TaxID=314236 RepID=A0A368YSU4_9HYPH|nr:hypothetical protein C7476_11196 [Phyllobacterium bourgognense]
MTEQAIELSAMIGICRLRRPWRAMNSATTRFGTQHTHASTPLTSQGVRSAIGSSGTEQRGWPIIQVGFAPSENN